MNGQPWQFNEWFVAQHGPRPSDIDEAKLLDKIKSARIVLANDEHLLARIEAWEARRTSALYAWQIGDAEKAGNGARR